MQIQETELTPELAARLLANVHPRQRRPGPTTVEAYARTIREGGWQLVADPILVAPDGCMFNGGQRCAAVISAHRSIPIFICWDADPESFDVIDIGRRRAAYQFISQPQATRRAAAARLILWYEHRFERAPDATVLTFDLRAVLQEVERRSDAFDAVLPAARMVYDSTGLSQPVCLAAFAIAYAFGLGEEVNVFARGVDDPHGLSKDDPAFLLAERFRKHLHKEKRRRPVEDWTILVRALNLHLQGLSIVKLQMNEVWPRVAESEADYRRRQVVVANARMRDRQRAQDPARRSRARA